MTFRSELLAILILRICQGGIFQTNDNGKAVRLSCRSLNMRRIITPGSSSRETDLLSD